MRLESIDKYLDDQGRQFRVTLHDVIDSTNKEAKRIARRSSSSDNMVIIADAQTEGRGRRDHAFFSPDGSGIYMSFLTRLGNGLTAADSTYLMPLTAAAAAEAIKDISGREAGIKWVNDIMIEGKKVAGILIEGLFSENAADTVISGIGINVFEPESGFPEDISESAGAVFRESGGSRRVEDIRERLSAEVINRFARLYLEFAATRDSSGLMEKYRSMSAIIGKEVTVNGAENERVWTAVAEEIDDECHLIVRNKSGERVYLSSEEISIKLKDI